MKSLQKKKKVEDTQPSPEELARQINDMLDKMRQHAAEADKSAAQLHWQLGEIYKDEVLSHPDWKWADETAFAAESGCDETRYKRAKRIREQHPQIESLQDVGVIAACCYGDDKKVAEPRTPQPLEADLDAIEWRAAGRFLAAVGGQERAIEVARKYDPDSKPKGAVRKKSESPLLPILRLVDPDMRDEFLVDPDKFVSAVATDVQHIDEKYEADVKQVKKAAEAAIAVLTCSAGTVKQKRLQLALADAREEEMWALRATRRSNLYDIVKPRLRGVTQKMGGDEILSAVAECQSQLHSLLAAAVVTI